ncbi:DUF6988 family protein [Pseudidiomarina sediminum]|uniref:DUF6988 family protein n=1 Tax=Pseudidiomarina sediminum TaxID=431675 RepID=UPI001C952028|nr:hypothetical protein [Pseudidiomarina sediminum]MBY6063265.1 hypothetical protein [Pseudidiomarina sediminum]
MELKRVQQLFSELYGVIEGLNHETSKRIDVSLALSNNVLQLSQSILVLSQQKHFVAGAVLLRAQFESIVRSVWSLHVATDAQVNKLSPPLETLMESSSNKLPMLSAMLEQLDQHSHLVHLMTTLREFKGSSWSFLNSFVHSGHQSVVWTQFRVPEELHEQLLKGSNNIALLAFINIGLLSGVEGIQKRIHSVAAKYPDCFGPKRN